VTKYSYVATRPDGRRTRGVQKAKNRRAAERALYQRQLRDIRINEKSSFFQFELTSTKVKREEIMHMSRQLAAFVRAGLPLIEAVHALRTEAKNPGLRTMMADVEDGLQRGETFSECLNRHPKIFPEFYRGILRSAELTGKLDAVLDQLATYLERDLEARRKVKAAMTYPAMIVVLSLITVIILASFVLPRFEVFFSSLNAKLPLPTRMLLFVTGFLTIWWWAVLAGLIGLAVTIWLVIRTPGGRHLRDSFYLKIPVIGETVQYALVERFCRVLASMAAAGVSLPDALRVATESLTNLVFVNSLSQVGEALLEGEGLAKPLANSGLFPGTAARMIRVGEDTGTLHTQLEFTARYYEGELDYKLKKLTSLVEPVVIIVMGLIVGFVAIALVSAMYGIYGQVKVK
jgi:type IV pilus assembly protein PilC